MKEKDRNQTTCDTWLTKSTKQGAVFDFDHNDEEYEFDGSYENSSSKSSSALFVYFSTQVVHHRSPHPFSFLHRHMNMTVQMIVRRKTKHSTSS